MKEIDFDWDKFQAEGRELAQRMRQVITDLDRQRAARRPTPPSSGHSLGREQPPPDSAWNGRFDRFERMLTDTLNTVTVLQREVSVLQRDVSGLQRDVGGLQREVTTIREQMATKVELEALQDSIRLLADGYAQTQTRLDNVTELLRRYLTS